MQLSVIVPVHNGGAALVTCLENIVASTRKADELIVVDDASSDGSCSTARHFGARVINGQARPQGPAWARNAGARVATGDTLVFIDADVQVRRDTLGRIESVFAQSPTLQALFGSYDDNPPAPGIASRFKNLLHHYVHQHAHRNAHTFWAGCGAIRKHAFVAAGGFDERYRTASAEDLELGVRLHRAGMPIRLCPEIQVTHLKRWTLLSLWKSDIFARAIPWTRIIVRERSLPADLNLTWRSRASAASVWVALAFLAASLVPDMSITRHTVVATAGIGCALAVTAALNMDLYRFFFRRGGPWFAICAYLLHATYLLYASGVFMAVAVPELALRKMHLGRTSGAT